MAQNFMDFAKTGIYKAKKMGADHAELFVLKSKNLDVQLKEEKIDEMHQSESQGIGIRVIKGKRQGFSFSSDFSVTALDKMVHQAIVNSSYSDVEEALDFAQVAIGYPKLELFDKQREELKLEDKLILAKATADYAKQYDSRVTKIERSGYEEGEGEVWLANSYGVLLHEKSSYSGLYCLALGQKNEEQQSGYGMDAQIWTAQLSPKLAGEQAAKRAVSLLGAEQMPSQTADLILEPYIAAQIMGIISQCFSAGAVQKGKSFLAGQLEQQVASSHVNLIDDGTLAGRLGSSAFDGEGTATQRTVLIEQGVLKHYLYDTLTANKDKTSSTGNGVRNSYQGTPYVGTTNYYLENGQLTVEELFKSVANGLYVTEILGAHTANPISGDFSFGASGIWIENGQLTKPVRGMTIAGNFQQLLQKIDGAANDLTFFGSKGAPTIKISQIAISGK